MSLKIRLARYGSNRRAFFEIVVTDSRSPRNGRFIERIGYYNPRTEPSIFQMDMDRYEHWYRVGARPSDAIAAMLRSQKRTSK